jgi:hypothetical protein
MISSAENEMIASAENVIPDLDATPKIVSPPTPAHAGPGKGKCWKKLMEQDRDTDSESDSASDTNDDSLGMMTNMWKGQLKKYYISRLRKREKVEKENIKCTKKKLDWTRKKKKIDSNKKLYGYKQKIKFLFRIDRSTVRFKFFKMSKYNLSLKKVTKPKINVLSESDSASDTNDDSVGMMTNMWKGQLKKYYISRLRNKEKVEKENIKCAKKIRLDAEEKKILS